MIFCRETKCPVIIRTNQSGRTTASLRMDSDGGDDDSQDSQILTIKCLWNWPVEPLGDEQWGVEAVRFSVSNQPNDCIGSYFQRRLYEQMGAKWSFLMDFDQWIGWCGGSTVEPKIEGLSSLTVSYSLIVSTVRSELTSSSYALNYEERECLPWVKLRVKGQRP